MADILSVTNLIIGVIGGIFGVVGGITGAIVFVNKTMNSKVAAAVKGLEVTVENNAKLQKGIDSICEQDRETIETNLQTITGKTVLLESELRHPDKGIYVRLKAVETTVSYVEKEIAELKRLTSGTSGG